MFLSISVTHHIVLLHEIIEETYFKEIKILGYVYFGNVNCTFVKWALQTRNYFNNVQ